MSLLPAVSLPYGVSRCTGIASPLCMPPVGIGTYELRGEECVQAVCSALRLGFRLIDTAAVYRNEALVGEGIRLSGVPREDIFVVVKIAMKSMDSTEKLRTGILQSVEQLGIGYADGLLIHWPGCGGLKPEDAEGHRAARRRCWEVMHALQREGVARCIGVSNFLPRHFQELVELDWGKDFERGGQRVDDPSWLPLINQIELHPLCPQEDTVEFCRSRGMVLQQYSPLGKGDPRLLQHPQLLELQRSHFPSFSIPDLCLLWGLSQGFVPLVRSHSVEHLRHNWHVALDFFQVPQEKTLEDEGHCKGRPEDVAPRRRPRTLSSEQRDMLRQLPELLGVAEDEHLCWNSITIA